MEKRTRKRIFTGATKLGQGYVFTGVCNSVHRGGVSASVHAGIHTPLGADTPWEQTPPGADTPPEQTPPWSRHHPAAEHAGRYGQRAGGTHPTGMQSCFLWCLSLLNVNIKLDSLWTHLEAMSLSVLSQYKRTVTSIISVIVSVGFELKWTQLR